jgi:hypothetical protein
MVIGILPCTHGGRIDGFRQMETPAALQARTLQGCALHAIRLHTFALQTFALQG